MRRRSGFTLVEILVVIGLILLLTVMVVGALRMSGAEKIRSGARIAQSAILAARDRALYAGSQNSGGTGQVFLSRRGFRVTRDPNDTNLGTGFALIQPIAPQIMTGLSADQLDLLPSGMPDGVPDVIRISGLGGGWNALWTSGFFPAHPRVWFPYSTGVRLVEWTNPLPVGGPPYTSVDIYPVDSTIVGTIGTGLSMRFEVYNELLPSVAPIPLPSGIVIDIARSSLSAQNDLMFSPRGSLSGIDAASGPIAFLLRDVRDYVANINPADISPNVLHRSDLIVALFPQTGHVGTFELSLIDSNADNLADDIFAYAKAGSAAGQ